jgi:hypothetical protein
MKCDICGQDVENSEELQKHKEQEHPAGEKPDEPGETSEEPAAIRPMPAH